MFARPARPMTGRVFSVNISAHRGGPKEMVRSAFLEEGAGFKDDAHAGSGRRQVSLLTVEEIEKVESAHPGSDVDFRPGIFAENITTQDLDLSRLKLGDQLIVGDSAVLKVTQIGKDCPAPCQISRRLGQCIMPRQGIFCSAEKAGVIKIGDRIRVRREKNSLLRATGLGKNYARGYKRFYTGTTPGKV